MSIVCQPPDADLDLERVVLVVDHDVVQLADGVKQILPVLVPFEDPARPGDRRLGNRDARMRQRVGRRPWPWWQDVHPNFSTGCEAEEGLAKRVRAELSRQPGVGVVAAVDAHVAGLAAVDRFAIDVGFGVLPVGDHLLDLEGPHERADEVGSG